jgi:leader peptidase (prepilin peptidase) / N-methyltransferase
VDVVQVVAAGLVGLLIGSLLNRLVVREPGYVVTDPADLPEDADRVLLDELEDAPVLEGAVPLVAVFRPGTWWRRWFPVTEVVVAALFAVTVHRLGWGWSTVAVLFLVCALVVLSAVDFRVYRIPDRLNFPSMGIGFALITLASVAADEPGAVLGAAFGGLSYASMLFLAHVAHPRGMGWGDVKLAWLMGFYLGWVGWDGGPMVDQLLLPLQSVLLGAAAGSVVGVVTGGAYALIRRSMRAVFPYGPSLATGCLLVVISSAELV